MIPAGETKYVLSKITLVPEDAPARGNGGRDIGRRRSRAGSERVRLDDSADSVIAPHVGDRVRVVGTVVATPPAPTDANARNRVAAVER